MQPDVSVVIPTYNRRGFLESAVQSCFAGNDALDVEVVVVDDGSTDDTRDYLRALDDERVRPVFQEHQGAQSARNRGLDEARGTFIKFLDDDDWLMEGALVGEVRALRETQSDVSYGDLLVVNARREERKTMRNQAHPDMACGIFEFSLETLPPIFTYRYDLIAEVEWDPDLDFFQDTEFAISVASRRPESVKVEQTVAAYRKHDEDSITSARTSRPLEESLHRDARLISEGIEKLRRRGELRECHRRAAARGLWQWAHMLAPYDFDGFEKWYERLIQIQPDFRPSRPVALLGLLDRMLSPRATERILQPIRKMQAKYRTGAPT